MKTEEQLQQQAENLKVFSSILEKYNLPVIATDGIVLGYVRDKDFIPWDPDGDLFIDARNITPDLKDNLFAELEKNGFEPIFQDGNDNWKVSAKKDNFVIELRAFYISGDKYYRKLFGNKFVTLRKFFDTLTPCELRGWKFNIAGDYVGYLEYNYKNWKVVQRGKRSEYHGRGYI